MNKANIVWTVSSPILLPGEKGSFDEVSVKDPSVVYYSGKWHVFYTAGGKACTGYVSANTLKELQTAPRFELTQIRGKKSRYACAPQVFFFEPEKTWYLIYQTMDKDLQPVYSTTKTIDKPES